MKPSCLVFAPVRFSARSFMRSTVTLLSVLLFPLVAQAGTYTWTKTDANGNIIAQSPTFSGGHFDDIYYTPNGPNPYESSGNATGTGDSSGQTSSSGDLTASFSWQPDPGKTLTTDPPSVCVVREDCYASYYGQGPFTKPPTCDDGMGDPNINGYSSGTHYRVKVPDVVGDFTVTLSGAEASISPVNIYASVFSSGVTWKVTVVNGNWAGPYYFHHGYYTTLGARDGGIGIITTPWANNTANATPTIEDAPDSTNSFTLSDPNSEISKTEGYITPVWYWTGPDLGVPPPPFEIDLEVEAYSVDSANTYDSGISDDGRGDPDISVPGGARSSGSSSVAVSVQSDVYAPGEGNGYWAIGPTVHMSAELNPPPNESAPYSVDTSVSLSASIEDGLNN